MNPKDLFEALLHAEDEDAVVAILDKEGYSLDNADVWRPLGENEANFTTVGNQQDEGTAALVEKIVNSVDAVLVSECHAAEIDPTSAQAPATMHEATEQFLGVKEGRLDYLGAGEQRELAKRINFIATGTKMSPCYVIVDDGEGQTPNRFPDTFLSTTRQSPKVKIPFVQGKFNAGGTGSLQFSGKLNLQLVVSRRQPHAPVEDGDDSGDLWGFTIIRRRRPKRDRGEKKSVFFYLAPDGHVPRFKAEFISVLPSKSGKNRPPEPYAEPLKYGTCMKLYNYRWAGRGIATLEARRELERIFQIPCLPFRITEARRGYSANYYSTTVIGVWNALRVAGEGDGVESENLKMEKGFPASAEVNLQGIGRLPMTIGLWKEDTVLRHVPTGIYFLINGQVHGLLGGEFISRRLDKDYIKDHLLITVDCTGIDPSVSEDLFMPSRDRMRKNEDYDNLRDALAKELKDHDGLKQWNAMWRQRKRERANTATDNVENVFSELLRRDPALARLFAPGSKVITSVGPGVPPKFEGKKFPTYFRIQKEPKGGLVKHCPVNRTVKIDFETDAINDYFTRPDEPGSLEVDPTPDLIESQHLWNGQFTAKFRVPWDAKSGDRFTVKLMVNDVMRTEQGAFECAFTLIADPEAEDTKRNGGDSDEQRDPHSPLKNRNSTSLALPNPVEVQKADWEKYGFKKATDALRVKRGDGDKGGYDYYINVDNAALLQEAQDPHQDLAKLKYWFKWGLTIAAFAMIREQEEALKLEAADDDRDGDEDERGVELGDVQNACDGLGRVIITIIRALHEGPSAAESEKAA